MQQLKLVKPTRVLINELISYRCGDSTDVVLRGDLAIADPPWAYRQKFGASEAADHYDGLPVPVIIRHLARLRTPRMAMWITGPIDETDWPAKIIGWGRGVSRGAWVKTRGDLDGDEEAVQEAEENEGHYGQGFHWAGCAEYVKLYTRRVRTPDGRDWMSPYIDRGQKLRNSHVGPPMAHSWKPVRWMSQWIRRWVPPGGKVVDPYAGLGSVAHAVLHAGGGRRYEGYEIDPERHADGAELLSCWDPERFDPFA